MEFFTEPPGYEKTLLSDLPGAWESLREMVVKHAGFAGWERVLFHLDEAMRWETVRHLDRMGPLVVLIRHVAVQGGAPTEVMASITDMAEMLHEVHHALQRGEPW